MKQDKIALVFNKLPVSDRTYKIVSFVNDDGEVAVNVEDGSPGNFGYVSSMENTGYVHIYLKEGKRFYWANDVHMECWPRFARCRLDSFRVSFDLSAR